LKLLLQKLSLGLAKKDISRKHKVFIDSLVKKNIIISDNNVFFIHSDYVAGVIDIAKNGTGFLQSVNNFENKKDLLIEKNNLFGAIKGDLVVAKKIFSRKTKAKVCIIVQNISKYCIVYLNKTKGGKIQAYNMLTNAPLHINASQKSLKLLPKDCLLKIDSSSLDIKEVLGVMSDATIDEKISLALYNKIELFDTKSEMEAKSFGSCVDKNMYKDRVDLTSLPFCTIDPPSAKDHDDAIYFDKKENILYVAIADVSEYVSEFGFIDKDAYERCFSIYFPHKSIPMLPRTLSENICSLKEAEDRLSFVCKIEFDEEFNVISEDFVEAIINSKKKYTYDEVDLLLEKKENINSQNNEILDYLFDLFNITQILRKRRLKVGFTFNSDELRMNIDENANIISVSVEKETYSHSLIEECMLLANKASANKIGEKGIFRIHEKPDIAKIEDMIINLHTIGIDISYKRNLHSLILEIQEKAKNMDLVSEVDKLLIQTQKQAKYASANIGHFGLGFDEYSHFTSPIRRYPDLVLHRILKSILKNDIKKHKYILSQLDFICEQASGMERESAKVQWDFEDRKFARWANENIGTIIEGVVVDTRLSPVIKMTNPFNGARIFLDTFSVDIKLFNTIKATISRVDMFGAKIYANEIID